MKCHSIFCSFSFLFCRYMIKMVTAFQNFKQISIKYQQGNQMPLFIEENCKGSIFQAFQIKSSIKSLASSFFFCCGQVSTGNYVLNAKEKSVSIHFLTKNIKRSVAQQVFHLHTHYIIGSIPSPIISIQIEKILINQYKRSLRTPPSTPSGKIYPLLIFQYLFRVIIVILGGIDRHNMNYLANLFSCGRAEKSNHPGNCLSVFRKATITKKMTNSDRSKNKEDSTMTKTMSNSSRPASSMYDVQAKKLPQPNFLVLRGCFNKKEKDVNWGFLVGLVGCPHHHEKLIPAPTMCVRIGRGQQLRSLESLRKNALDRLLVYWSELDHQFSLAELIRCRQALVLVVQQWSLVLQLVKAFEQELLKTLGEFCLQESSSRIFFNIITVENKYALEFQEAHLFKEHAKAFLEKTLSVCLEQEDFNFLLEKMTLNDYVHMRKDPQLMERKIRHYISEIGREKAEKESAAAAMDVQDTVARCHSQKFSKFSEEQIIGIRKDSKQSDVELQALYFAQSRKQGADAVIEASPPEEGLLIYYFNNGQDIPEEEIGLEPPPRPINFVRKIRSKSEDATYVPEGLPELDDEFFQKYQ